ncbi:MAG: glycoside hydrolase family 127 protein [Clostridia bacterium]|nr:glycoside hydrolase family 127 protein [Clostridia bacterium]
MWDTEIQTIKVIEETDFPYDGKVKITFEPERPQDFTLRLRIPHYLESDVDVYINGGLYKRAERGTYIEIYRNWKKGDYVSFELVLAFKEHLYYGDHDVDGYTRCAYTYGPILLTVVGEKNHENGIVIKGTPQELIGKLRPQERPFYFDIEGEDNCYVAPYFEVGEVEWHCYPMFRGHHKPDEPPKKPDFGVQGRPWIRE